MKKINILDCTLRDGGFINQWDFGQAGIKNIYRRLQKSGVEIIEIGYFRDNVVADKNISCYSSLESARWVMEDEKRNAITVGIIDYGDFDEKNLHVRTSMDVDGLRVTFKKKDISKALQFCKKIKELGFLIFIQPVSVMDYDDAELIELIRKIREIDPYAVSIVDTYGFMQKQDILRLFYLFDNNLPEKTCIGYHGHNNLQLAFSNAVELVDHPIERELIIDTSVYGMGKSAGNSNTELMALFLNEHYNKKYIIYELLEIIDSEVCKYQKEGNWGYSLKYFISSAFKCHPKYIEYLIRKKSLSITNICDIAENIPEQIRTTYNEEYIEKAYFNFRDLLTAGEVAYNQIKDVLCERKVLVLAPGESLVVQHETISNEIKEKKPYVIGINFWSKELPLDCIFFNNQKRYQQCSMLLDSNKVELPLWVSDYVTDVDSKNSIKVNVSKLIEKKREIKDNAVLVFLNLIKEVGIKEVTIAGMDGFFEGNKNFASKYMNWNEFQDVKKTNEIAKKELTELSKSMKINFLTKSMYTELQGG